MTMENDDSHDRPAIVFGGYDCRKPGSHRSKTMEMEWYAIKAPDPNAETFSSSSKRQKLNPFSTVELHKRNHNIAALGSCLYCFSKCTNQVCTLDLNHPSDGWKQGPPTTLPREASPHTFVIDGKLYVIGGLKSTLPQEQQHWMEVFDPSLGTWESLPNPPSEITTSTYDQEVFAALLESKKEILVVPFLPLNLGNNHIDKREWLEGRLIVHEEIFGKRDYPFKELDISVVSIQKYPMDHDIEILDALLLQPTVSISAALLKQPQEEPVAEMMDCKKSLGLSIADNADKKSSQIAANGRIGSYIHDSHIGVLIEVNCETYFVCRSENFKDLVDDLAMQVAVCPKVQFVSIENIPESFVNKERELEMQRDDNLLSKPENIRQKIVEGRVSKMLRELALLEQPFIKNDNILVKDLLKQTIATVGENIKVKRETVPDDSSSDSSIKWK
nr:elongation factor ts [Quercus suber]